MVFPYHHPPPPPPPQTSNFGIRDLSYSDHKNLVSRRDEISRLFPNFFRLRLDSYVCLRLVRSLGACSRRKFSKLGCSDWLKINFTQQNSLTLLVFFNNPRLFPDFFSLHRNSLTFSGFPRRCLELPVF